MKMVVYQCKNPTCQAVFAVDVETVDAFSYITCPSCRWPDPEEIGKADMEWEEKANV